jgi:hypothetical protein
VTDEHEIRDDDTSLLTALTTEHFVLQSTRATITSEAGTRTSLYIGALSSVLIALGFIAQFEDAFAPFAAAVLPALLVLGVFTYVRLVEISVEDLHYLGRIQQIRAYYRELSPRAAQFFPGAATRSDEALFESLSIGRRQRRFQFLFTAASMVAAINSIVAGVAIALLLDGGFGVNLGLAIVAAVAVALAAMCTHGIDEVRRFDRLHAAEPGSPDTTGA